jgi:PTS system N-acetylglucosamine-specific IIC component
MARHAAPKGRRAIVGGLLASMALTSFLTGVTEPIEYAFMFLAPVLYAIHAVLTGLSLAICSALGIKLGFTFSAGAIDYVLNYGLSTKGWEAIPVGIVYFIVYYCSASLSPSSTWQRRVVKRMPKWQLMVRRRFMVATRARR